MKRILSITLILAMSLTLLAGCGSGGSTKDTKAAGSTQNQAAGETKSPDTAKSTEGTDGGDASVEGKKDYINYDEEPYEVVIECLNLGSNTDSVPAIEEAVNAITVPAINVTVKLQVIHIADHATKTALWAAGGEKIDIYYVGTTVPFSQFVSDGMIVPITELMDTNGSAIKEKSGALLDAFTVDGQIYAIPQNLYCAGASGIDYNNDMVSEYGIELPEKWDMGAMTEIGYKLKEAAPDKYLMAKNGSTDATEMGVYYGLDSFGTGTYAYGVLVNPETDTKVINIYKSDLFKEYCKYNIEWKENGFMPADQAVNGENAQDVYKNEMSFCQWVNVAPSEQMSKQAATSFDSQQAAFTNARLTSRAAQEKAWGISTNCERPDKAMDFLNFLYENAEVSNLLSYGIEGSDYVFADGSDKVITYPEGIDAANVGWSKVFCLFGDDMNNFVMAPATEDYYTELKNFNDNAVSCATLGYTFDATNVSTQVASVTTVVNEYVPSLVYGEIPEADLDSYIQELNDKLDGAGINEIIEENQAQINAWLEANK